MSHLLLPALVGLCLLSLLRILPALWAFRRAKSERSRQKKIDPAWGQLAEGLFLRHGQEVSLPDRVERAMRLGMQRLEMDHALVTVRRGATCTVKHSYSVGYQSHPALVAGADLPGSLLYCGMLSEARSAIAIDAASVSDWRRHPACRDLSWECYVGVGRSLADGSFLSVCFFQARPRESLFSRGEKEFVSQLGSWITALHERYETEAVGMPVAAQPSAELGAALGSA